MISHEILKKPFYFVRHGETDWNLKGLYQGITDIPLNQTGVNQAQKTAEILRNQDFSYIVCSPLARALKTAEIISAFLNKEIIVIDELKELSVGEKEGTPGGDETFFQNWLLGVTPKGGESIQDFHHRVHQGLQKALELEGTALIVSHGGVFTAIRRLLNLPMDRIHNCELYCHFPSQSQPGDWEYWRTK